MKIGIMLSRVPYPLEKGDKLRIFHHIKILSKNHEIYLCCLNIGKIHPESLEVLKEYCQEIKIIKLGKLSIVLNLVYSLLFTKLPLQIAYFFNRKAKKKVHHFFKNQKIDLLYCQLIRTAEYIKDFKGVPKTLDYMDALSQGMERRIERSSALLKPFVKIESLRLKQYEHFIFSAFDEKTIISAQDRDLIVHVKNHQIHIISNGVDQDYFSPLQMERKYDLLFTGNMSYPPNVISVEYIVKELLPEIRKRFPEIIFVIAGANPSSRVQRLAGENVIVTGWVDDIRGYYAQSKLFLAPMQIGTGLQNKLLEAMAMKVPCITSQLANNALGGTHQKHLMVGKKTADYVKEVLFLLENPEIANRLGTEAFQFIHENYSWEMSVSKLEALFLNQISKKTVE